jgi:hypothetical protein
MVVPKSAIELEHQLDDAPARRAVEVAGGLVGEENAGPVGEGAGQGDALLFPPESWAG